MSVNELSIEVFGVDVVKSDKSEYAEYRIAVREGACKFEVVRRWSHLKTLMEALARTEPKDMNQSSIPKFEPHSFRLWGHTAPDFLEERKDSMQALLDALADVFCVSVTERSGPKALLEFLEAPVNEKLAVAPPADKVCTSGCCDLPVAETKKAKACSAGCCDDDNDSDAATEHSQGRSNRHVAEDSGACATGCCEGPCGDKAAAKVEHDHGHGHDHDHSHAETHDHAHEEEGGCATGCCGDKAAAKVEHGHGHGHDEAQEEADVEHVLFLNGINCGGCSKGVIAALSTVDGVTEVIAETKAETGIHPNKVTIRGSDDMEAIVEAIRALDAGRGKYTLQAPPLAADPPCSSGCCAKATGKTGSKAHGSGVACC